MGEGVDRLTSMEVFARVVAARSFSAAARDLGISQATASKHVQMLEGWIGSRLLNRTTRRVSLTDTGEHFYVQCVRILEDMEAARQAGKPDARLRGSLRISAPVAFGSTRLGALAVEFMRLNEELSLNVILSDRPVDVIEEGYDLALRIWYGDAEPERPPGLVVQPIARIPFVTCAAPGYLSEHGVPNQPAELAQHTCLTDMRHPGDIWRFAGPAGETEVHVSGHLKTDNGLLRRSAARAGAGVLVAPQFLVEDDLRQGRLVRILREHQPPSGVLDSVCPAHRAVSPKVRGLISFLSARLEADQG